MTGQILTVENDEQVQTLLIAQLHADGYGVHAVSSGVAMFELLTREQIDLVVLDLSLPDGDGLSTIQKLKSQSNIPIVATTTRTGADDRMLALGLGVDDYLVKPFEPRELSLRISNILERTAGNSDSGQRREDSTDQRQPGAPARGQRASDNPIDSRRQTGEDRRSQTEQSPRPQPRPQPQYPSLSPVSTGMSPTGAGPGSPEQVLAQALLVQRRTKYIVFGMIAVVVSVLLTAYILMPEAPMVADIDNVNELTSQEVEVAEAPVSRNKFLDNQIREQEKVIPISPASSQQTAVVAAAPQKKTVVAPLTPQKKAVVAAVAPLTPQKKVVVAAVAPGKPKPSIPLTRQKTSPTQPSGPRVLTPSQNGASKLQKFELSITKMNWVGQSKCGAIPAVNWWAIKTHVGIVRYVLNKHGGNFQEYVDSWNNRQAKLKDVFSRGSGVATKTKIILTGADLQRYISQVTERIQITTCLSREAVKADPANYKVAN